MPPCMTEQEAVERLAEIRESYQDDIQIWHQKADELIIEVLRSAVQFNTLAADYSDVPKWYH